jgi:hypothetical protein
MGNPTPRAFRFGFHVTWNCPDKGESFDFCMFFAEALALRRELTGAEMSADLIAQIETNWRHLSAADAKRVAEVKEQLLEEDREDPSIRSAAVEVLDWYQSQRGEAT